MSARVTTLSALVAVFAAGCAVDEATPEAWSDAWILEEGARYLSDDASYRREALLDSLESHDNVYARERIANYGLGDSGWDALPAWNPRAATVTDAIADGLAAGEPLSLSDDVAPLWDGVVPETMQAWIALGQKVFFGYPLRTDPFIAYGLSNPELGAAMGMVRAPDGSRPGVLALRYVDGTDRIGIACAACHTDVRGGELVVGTARRGFNYGGLRVAYHEATGAPVDPDLARRMATWGPGRADITADDSEDPVAIPDLWGLRHQTSLTQAGTIRHVSPSALAIRQETQLLHANLQRARPPRVLSWALAMFLYSLEPPAHPGGDDPDAVEGGEAIFEARCSGCHQNEVYGGPVVSAEVVGTEPSLAFGGARGTGLYRPPTLLRVRDAAPYFHDGSVANLEELFSSDRLDPSYDRSPLGPGPVMGHEFGTDLAVDDRAALIAFLSSL